jgi:mRNA-degrading endonuclease RelE of RelBE toxin-antitoxin system
MQLFINHLKDVSPRLRVSSQAHRLRQARYNIGYCIDDGQRDSEFA